jgi:hypothetical protein
MGEANTIKLDKGPFKAGRPFKFTDPEKFRQAIRAYFDLCDPHIERRMVDKGVNQQGETIWQEREIMTHQRPYTLSGLARALDVDRSTLLNYQNPEHYSDEIPDEARQEIIGTLSLARARCEEYAEAQLFEGNANGAKFNLTNNYDKWTDRTVVDTPNGLFGNANTLKVEIVNNPTVDETPPAANDEGQADAGADDPAQPDAEPGVPAP